MRKQLPLLLQHSTTVKEVVYKLFYSIAISNFPHAEARLAPGSTLHQTFIEQQLLAKGIVEQKNGAVSKVLPRF